MTNRTRPESKLDLTANLRDCVDDLAGTFGTRKGGFDGVDVPVLVNIETRDGTTVLM